MPPLGNQLIEDREIEFGSQALEALESRYCEPSRSPFSCPEATPDASCDAYGHIYLDIIARDHKLPNPVVQIEIYAWSSRRN